MSELKCPKCGSTQISVQAIANTSGTISGKTKGFGWIKTCLGTMVAGPFGFLCGFCGMGKGKTKGSVTTKVEQIKICQKCGHNW